MTDELKPCPFCGFGADFNQGRAKIECQGEWCNASMHGVQGDEELIRCSNTRHDNSEALNKLAAKIRQKKGFYSGSVGNSEIRQAHKAGILKGLDAAENEISVALSLLTAQEGN